MVKTIIDFDPNAKTVTVSLKGEDKQFAASLLLNGWKWKIRGDEIRMLERRWYKGMFEFLLDLFSNAHFTDAFCGEADRQNLK